MTDLKMTPARIALLHAVADPGTEVNASAGRGGSWSTAEVWMRAPGELRRKVTKRVDELEIVGLVKLAPVGVRYHQPRDYSLTEAGSKVLADLDAKE